MSDRLSDRHRKGTHPEPESDYLSDKEFRRRKREERRERERRKRHRPTHQEIEELLEDEPLDDR